MGYWREWVVHFSNLLTTVLGIQRACTTTVAVVGAKYQNPPAA